MQFQRAEQIAGLAEPGQDQGLGLGQLLEQLPGGGEA
jgi:hypothetical protein